MDNKDTNQDDLVVSSTGEMLTKDESEQRQIEVRQEPAHDQDGEPTSEPSESQPSQQEGPATNQPTGLAPPSIPQQSHDESSKAPNVQKQLESSQSQEGPKSTSGEQQQAPNDDTMPRTEESTDMTDEEFAKRHSNHERSSSPGHHTRNNKKVLAALIVFGALALCALAVFVYLSTQENVSELDTQQTTDNMLDETAEQQLPVQDEISGENEGTIEPLLDGSQEDELQIEESTDPTEPQVEEVSNENSLDTPVESPSTTQ